MHFSVHILQHYTIKVYLPAYQSYPSNAISTDSVMITHTVAAEENKLVMSVLYRVKTMKHTN
jgi:hypothetical protein